MSSDSILASSDICVKNRNNNNNKSDLCWWCEEYVYAGGWWANKEEHLVPQKLKVAGYCQLDTTEFLNIQDIFVLVIHVVICRSNSCRYATLIFPTGRRI